jgi:GMP synthase (glutamine-hydrolysing)
MSKPFLIIQLRPEDSTADNELEAICQYGGLQDDEVVRVRAEQAGLPEFSLDDFSAIIVGGSPFDVSTPPGEKSDIQKQIEQGFSELFVRIEARDFPFLGACSGNGLLGSYCGASISTKYGEPVGGTDVRITDEGRQDPLLEGMPETIRVLCGHKEACDDVPPGSILLAGNDDCPVQMFRLKQNIYATQFHPEGDPAGFQVRIEAYRHHGYFPAHEADRLSAELEGEDVSYSQLILRRFVDRYRAD